MTGNEYAAETDWSKEQDKGKVSKGRNTKCQNRSIQISSLNDTREKILPFKECEPYELRACVKRIKYLDACGGSYFSRLINVTLGSTLKVGIKFNAETTSFLVPFDACV